VVLVVLVVGVVLVELGGLVLAVLVVVLVVVLVEVLVEDTE